MSDGESIENLWSDSTASGLSARRKRELRSVSPRDRAALRAKEVRSVQLNMKVTPSFRSRVLSLSVAERMSLPDLFEHIVDFYTKRKAD